MSYLRYLLKKEELRKEKKQFLSSMTMMMMMKTTMKAISVVKVAGKMYKNIKNQRRNVELVVKSAIFATISCLNLWKTISDDDTPCSICNSRDTWDNNQILYCDGCNLAFHQACYGVKNIPAGDYFCDMCLACVTKKDEYKSTPKSAFKRNECCLCPNGWLPLQRSKCNRWVHPQCVMFIGEAFLNMERKQI